MSPGPLCRILSHRKLYVLCKIGSDESFHFWCSITQLLVGAKAWVYILITAFSSSFLSHHTKHSPLNNSFSMKRGDHTSTSLITSSFTILVTAQIFSVSSLFVCVCMCVCVCVCFIMKKKCQRRNDQGANIPNVCKGFKKVLRVRQEESLQWS